MSSRVRKQTESQPSKLGPMKATLPMSSVLRGPLQPCSTTCSNFSITLTPPLRHISPEHELSGNRSPGAASYKGKFSKSSDSSIRRTASLDALYVRPTSNTFLLLDKSTQTEESFLDRTKCTLSVNRGETPTEMKMEKVIRQRLQRTQRGEHSVSSQTQSPIHAKASPVSIPSRTCPPSHMRPTRNSVEGLNQEIEKLVLYPGQQHTCRQETHVCIFSRGTPEGHRAPLADLLHGDTRSVNTQTPINGDNLSSDESQSTSPEEGTSITGASPRINRFLAREPPDGCEKVNSKLNDADFKAASLFKPCGFQLRPSLDSAFQPLQPIPRLQTTTESNILCEDNKDDDAAAVAATTTDVTAITVNYDDVDNEK